MKLKYRFIFVFVFGFVCLVLIYLLGFDLGNNIDEFDNDYVEFNSADVEEMVTKTISQFGSYDDRLHRYTNKFILQLNITANGSSDLWDLVDKWVSSRQLYREDSPEMAPVLSAMATNPITSADVGYRGTQLKLMLVLDKRQKISFKPQWYRRDVTIEGLPYLGHDRHNGEIAAFHLSRLLNLRRAPLSVGRVIDLETEILPVATDRLRNTFFTNGSDTCFYGKCLYCKNQASGVCANRTKLEGVMMLWLPRKYQFQKFRHPWARTYKAGKKARWEWDNDHYCGDVRQTSIYGSGPLLLDIIDTAIFDFLIGNADRHNFEVFFNDSDSMLIMFDNGKSFGNAWHDEHSILAPLYQCKQVRANTVHQLRGMAGGILSRVLRHVLSADPVAPVLTEQHYEAVDRRLAIVLHTIDQLVRSSSADRVIVLDGYS